MELINPTIKAFRRAAQDEPDSFWARAAESLPWHRPWDRVFEWDPEKPDDRGRYFRWFVGGQTNLEWNCVDRHVQAGKGGRAALVCEDERGERTALTYAQLQHEVRKTAAALRGLGIGKGERLGIYMSTCREAIVLLLASILPSGDAIVLILACVRIGPIHIAVFAGFGSGSLGDRIAMAGAKGL